MKRLLFLAIAASMMAACQKSFEQRAAEEAKAYTERNCPVAMGEYVIMDSMTFDAATTTFGYHYRFTGAMDADSVMLPAEMRQALLDALRNMTAMRAYKDRGYTFRYEYRSQKNPSQVLFETTFTKDDYQ